MHDSPDSVVVLRFSFVEPHVLPPFFAEPLDITPSHLWQYKNLPLRTIKAMWYNSCTMDEGILIERNIDDAEGRGQILMPLVVLAYILFFFTFHAIFSALLACVATFDFANEWLDVFLANLKSARFAYFSVGVPLVVFVCLFLRNIFIMRRRPAGNIVHEAMDENTRDCPDCQYAKAMELYPGDDYYEMLTRLARNAGMKTPRMFFIYNTPYTNAFTSMADDGPIVVLYERLSCSNGYHPNHVAAFLAHELGHIIGCDSARSTILLAAEYALANFWHWGIMCRHGADIAFKKECGNGLAQTLAAKFLVFTGWVYLIVGFIPYLAANRFRWLREYFDEYMADARGAKILGSSRRIAEALIVMAYRSGEWRNVTYRSMKFAMKKDADVHPPSISRIRRLAPDFDGNIERAARTILARYSR